MQHSPVVSLGQVGTGGDEVQAGAQAASAKLLSKALL